MPGYQAVSLIILIFLSFAFVHSLLVTAKVKNLSARLFGEKPVRAFYRLFYTSFSALTTAIAFYLIYQLPDEPLWRAPVWLSAPMRLLQISGLVIAAFAFRVLDSMEFMGVRQAIKYLSGNPVGGDVEGLTIGPLTESGIYGMVRNPLYLAGLMIFTLEPNVTRSGLTVSILADAYFIFGAFIEERRMIKKYGGTYLDYMKKVPRFFPSIRRSKEPKAI